MALHMPSRRSRLATATAFGLAAAIVAFGGTAPANAAPGDTAEAEGQLLTFAGTPDLSGLVALSGAYAGYAPGDTPDPQVDASDIDADVLSGVLSAQIAAGVQLGDVLTLDQAVAGGAADQFASAGSAGATGSAGVLTDSGAIAVNTGAGDAVTLDLAPLLASRGLAGVASDADISLGAVSATATDPGDGAVVRDYRIASADATIASPLVGALADDVNGAVQQLATGATAQIALSADVDGILTGVVGPLLTGVVDIATPTGNIVTTVDTAAAVRAVLAEPLTSDGVTVDLDAGTVTLDIAQYIQATEGATLNDLDPNTELLSAPVLAGVVSGLLSDALPAAVLEATLDATRVVVNVDAGVRLLNGIGIPIPVGTVSIDIDTTLANLLNPTGPGNEAPDIDVATTVLLLDAGALVQPLVDQLLPSIRTSTGNLLELSDVTAVTTSLIGSLAPVVDALADVVQLTANVQGASEFEDPDAADATGDAVTALRIALLPVVGGPVLDLATARVRAVVPAADDVVIQAPAGGQLIPLPAGATTVAVPVTGLADADATVTLSIDGGAESQPVDVAADGSFTLTTAALPAGTYTATVTQSIDGVPAGSDTVTFVVGAPLATLTITTPTPGQILLTTTADPTIDVPVEGAADPRADVTVTIPGQTPQTETVGTDGIYDVVFPDLGTGTYTATVTQQFGGVQTTETVTFTVGAPAAEITITSPDDDDLILSAGTVPTADVPVTGAADPRASVTVTIPGQDPQTELVGDDGIYDVLFADLPVGTYTATATQSIGGVASGTATVTFSVVAPAVAVVIDAPTDGQDFQVPAGGNAVDVTVSGSADPRGSVLIAVTGQTPITQVVGDDGRFEATFPGLTAAGYTVTVTQTVAGTPAGSDTSDFTVSVAGVDQVVIETPGDGDFIPLPDGDTTVAVPVTGTADPDATVTLTVGDVTTGPAEVDDDGDFTLTTPALPSGTYTGTVTQTIGGVAVGTDTVTFTIGVPVVIESPFDFQTFPLTGGATTRDVPISGTADPLGTVTVSIVGLDPIITPVDEDGNYSVTFFGLERGSYEAIATQTIGGAPAGDATVEFDVGVDGEEGVDSDQTAAIDVDGDGTDGTDGAADAAGTDATDAAGTDATDAAGTDATDAAGTDANDAAGTDATDAAGTDAADAAGTDATDAAGTDATDAAGTDATDAAGTEATDAAGTDATDAAGTDATDAAGTDATDAAGTDATDAAGTDATDAAGTDATDAAGTDATDAAGTDATDAAGTDVTDAAGTVASVPAAAVESV